MIVPVALLLVAIGMLDDTGSKGPDAVEVVVDAGIIGAPFMDVWISWMICAIRFWSEFNCAWSEAMVGPLAADAAPAGFERSRTIVASSVPAPS